MRVAESVADKSLTARSRAADACRPGRGREQHSRQPAGEPRNNLAKPFWRLPPASAAPTSTTVTVQSFVRPNPVLRIYPRRPDKYPAQTGLQLERTKCHKDLLQDLLQQWRQLANVPLHSARVPQSGNLTSIQPPAAPQARPLPWPWRSGPRSESSTKSASHPDRAAIAISQRRVPPSLESIRVRPLPNMA